MTNEQHVGIERVYTVAPYRGHAVGKPCKDVRGGLVIQTILPEDSKAYEIAVGNVVVIPPNAAQVLWEGCAVIDLNHIMAVVHRTEVGRDKVTVVRK